MGSISSCPHCGKQVSIPEGVDREATVRCPLCEAEFPLDRAMTSAADPPPQLIPVARPSADDSRDVSLAEETSEGLSLADETSGGLGVAEESDRAPAESDEVYAVAGAAAEAEEPGSEKYDFGGHAAGGAAAVWRSRQAEPSALGQAGKFIAIVLGGFLGIAVAYLVLSLVSPAHFDYLHVWGRPKSSAPNEKTSNGPPATPPGPDAMGRSPAVE